MEKINPIESFNWGPLVFKYEVEKNKFNNIKSIKPKINYTQGKEMDFSGVEIVSSRLGYSEDDHIKVLENLKEYFEDYILRTTHKKMDIKCTPKEVWINEYDNNHYINPHVHMNCDISFILYLKSNQNILDNDPQPLAGYTVFQYGQESDSKAIIRNRSTINNKPVDGQLIIFPNNLSHFSIPFQNPKIKRWTLSGNLTLIN